MTPPTDATTRLLFVVDVLDHYGPSRQLVALAQSLHAKGLAISVAVLRGVGDAFQKHQEALTLAGVTVEVLGRRFEYDPMALARLVQLIWQTRPTVVHGWQREAMGYCRLAARLAPVPHLVVSPRRFRVAPQHRFPWYESIARHPREHVVVNSESIAKQCQDAGKRRRPLTIMPAGALTTRTPLRRGTDLTEYKKSRRAMVHQQLEIDDDQWVLGYFGPLRPEKRVSDLIWATDIVRIGAWPIHLVIMGEGPSRFELQRFARSLEMEGRVHFLPPRDNAIDWIAGVDTVGLTSDGEGISNSLLEALSLQTPVIATRVPGNQSITGHDDIIHWVGPRKPFNIAQTLTRMIDDPQQNTSRVQAGQALARAQFHFDSVTKKYADFYRQLVAGREMLQQPGETSPVEIHAA